MVNFISIEMCKIDYQIMLNDDMTMPEKCTIRLFRVCSMLHVALIFHV